MSKLSLWRVKERPKRREKTLRLLVISLTRLKSDGMRLFISPEKYLTSHICRCDLFNKAYNHISDRIDQVYKDLTKGKAAPMGGVAYLSLEDSEVGHWPTYSDIAS